MTDTFKNHLAGLRDPIESATEVTPNDSTDLGVVSRAIYVGAAGNLRVTMLDQSVVTFAAGEGWHPIRVSRIWATGTTASSIVACH